MSEGLVKDCMTAPVISISSETVLSDARKIMTNKKVRRLPVVDNDKLVGIVSFTDVLEAKLATVETLNIWELSQQVLTMQVKDVMTAGVLSVEQDATLADAAKIMLEQKISGIPVTDNGKLVGMITESDLFRLMALEGQYLSLHHQKFLHADNAQTA
jgi:acetoin utilization protein AcuB